MLLKKIFKYLILKIKFSKKCCFDISSSIALNSEFEVMNKIHKFVNFSGKMGFGSYIGANSELNAQIGRFCSISRFVVCNNGIHPYLPPFVSTAPCFYSLNKNKSQNGGTFAQRQLFQEKSYANEEKKYDVIIKNDVWICEGVFLNGGITISDGAVVLAHAVVTKDVPPYAIVGGVPAKVLGYRYDEQTIKWLLEKKWWENDRQWFKENWELLSNIDKLQEFYKKIRYVK